MSESEVVVILVMAVAVVAGIAIWFFRGFKKGIDRTVELAKLYPSDRTEQYFKSAEAFCKMMAWCWGVPCFLGFGWLFWSLATSK
jgi:flagellar basal body-associated protein FliL